MLKVTVFSPAFLNLSVSLCPDRPQVTTIVCAFSEDIVAVTVPLDSDHVISVSTALLLNLSPPMLPESNPLSAPRPARRTRDSR